jgi:uncharacterized membrane protein
LGQDNDSPPIRRAGPGNEESPPASGEDAAAERGFSKEASETGGPDEDVHRDSAEKGDAVEVLPNVLQLLTAAEFGPEIPEIVRQRRRLNKVVHAMLVAGLAFSTAAMGTGLGLCLVSKAPLPSEILPLSGIAEGMKNLSPSAFLSLGLLLLIGTPVLRVLGTLIMFVLTREWRYVFLTLLVLAIISAGIMAGGG